MVREDTPLSRYAAVDTRAPDDAREAIGRIFCPHFLNPLGASAGSFHARHHTVQQIDYSVNFVAYGSTVEIDPGELSRFFLLQLPIKGSAKVRCGTVAADVQAGMGGSILSPTLGTRMTWNEGCEKLIVLLRREAVEAQFEVLTHERMRTIEFDTGVDLTGLVGSAIWQHAQLMLGAAEAGDSVPDAYRMLLRDGLTTLLLSSLASSVASAFQRPAPPAGPIAVRRAQEFMAANAERAISMAEIAAASGVSLRSLQDAYRKSRNRTLGEGLLALRLERFRAALVALDGMPSVSAAAFAAGFGHLGRAAAAYRERYGETPFETLKRRM
ncbi:helix-turn-helix domain-containing protein [Rhizobium sp. TH2]|uniref:AraC-like ligand-binding domain-containing protein n=1 Tax=Rhizobium sp. TH2 TaxID=2775403 RepID=UPI0021580872|nr:helix-turn-helix domain-containing protein [Rhizobium sp. TH2]UVC07959.1 helix-turn-helix domain-containing protein [Rhizobium sp. TH2]